MKRLIAWFLSLAMVIGLMPVQALAEETETGYDPYQYYEIEVMSVGDTNGYIHSIAFSGTLPVVSSCWEAGYDNEYYDWDYVLIDGATYYFAEDAAIEEGNTGSVALTMDTACSENRLGVIGGGYSMPTVFSVSYAGGGFVLSWEPIAYMTINDSESALVGVETTMGSGIDLVLESEQAITIQYKGEQWGVPAGENYSIGYRTLGKISEGASPIVLPAGRYSISANEWFPSREFAFSVHAYREYAVRDSAGNSLGAIQKGTGVSGDGVLKSYFAPGIYETYYTAPFVSEGVTGYTSEAVDTFEITEAGEHWVFVQGYCDHNVESNATISVLTAESIEALDVINYVEKTDKSASVYSYTASTDGYYSVQLLDHSCSLKYCISDANGSLLWETLWGDNHLNKAFYLNSGDSFEVILFPYGEEISSYKAQICVSEHQHTDIENYVCTECGMQMAASVYDYGTYQYCFFESLEEAFEDALEKNQTCYAQIEVYQSGEYLDDVVLAHDFAMVLQDDVEIHLKSVSFSGYSLDLSGGTIRVDEGIDIRSGWGWHHIQNQCHVIADITCENGNLQIRNATLEGNLDLGEDAGLGIDESATLYFDPAQYININDLSKYYIVQGSDEGKSYWTLQEYRYELVLADGSVLNKYSDGAGGYYENLGIDHLRDIFGNDWYPVRDEVNGLCHKLYFSMDASESLSPVQGYDYTYLTFSIEEGQPVMEFTRYMEYKQGENSGWNWIGIDKETAYVYGPEMVQYRLGEEILVPVDENGNVPENISGSGRYALVPYDETTMTSDHITFGDGNYRTMVNSDGNGGLVLIISKVFEWSFETYRVSDGMNYSQYYHYWNQFNIYIDCYLNSITIDGNTYYPTKDSSADQGRVELSNENGGYRVTFTKDADMDSTAYWPSITEQNGTYFFEWKKAPSVYWNDKKWGIASTTWGVIVEEDTESAIEYDGKLYGIRVGDSFKYNDMTLVEYEEGSAEAGNFIVPAGVYRLEFYLDGDSLHMSIRPRNRYELYDQKNVFLTELEVEKGNTLSNLPAGMYSVKVVKIADNGDELRETIITDVMIPDEGVYVLTLSQVDDYSVYETPNVTVEKKQIIGETDTVSGYINKDTSSSRYYFKPDTDYTGILHVSMSEEGSCNITDVSGNWGCYVPKGGRDISFSLKNGQELEVSFYVPSYIEGDGAEFSFWIEERINWECQAVSQYGYSDSWNSNWSYAVEVTNTYTVNSISVNGTMYYPAMDMKLESGSVLLQPDSNGSRLTFSGTYQEIMPRTSLWVTREGEGYVFHWEKMVPGSIDGVKVPWNTFIDTDIDETRELSIVWNGEAYGIPRDQVSNPGLNPVKLVKMTEENVIPVCLQPEKYKIAINLDSDRTISFNAQYLYAYYLKNADTNRFGDISGSSGLGMETLPVGTYELWSVKAEKILNEHANTGKVITVPDDGNEYLLNLGSSAAMGYVDPEMVRVIDVAKGEIIGGELLYNSPKMAYRYTANRDTSVTFEINALQGGSRTVVAHGEKQEILEFWGTTYYAAALQEGESVVIMPDHPWGPEPMGRYTIRVMDGCNHRDNDRDGRCDLCGGQLAVRITSFNGQQLFETFEDAITALDGLSNTNNSYFGLLGEGNDYVYDGQLVLNNCERLYFDLGGNSLTVTGGIVLNDSNINVYGDFDDTLEDTVLNADITIHQNPNVYVNGSDLWDLTYNGTITVEARTEDYPIIISLADGVFNGNIVAQSNTYIEFGGGAVVNADIQASCANIVFGHNSIMNGLVTCPDAENTNYYGFNRGLFSYRPDSLINPDYQVIIVRTIDGETYYQPADAGIGDAALGDSDVDACLEQLIEAEKLTVELLEPVITSNDAAGLSLTMEKNGSYDLAVDAICAARNATLKVALDELLTQIGGYDENYDEEIGEWVTTASLLGGTVEVEALLKINESSEIADNGRVRYELETSIETTLVYIDAEGNSMTMTWGEPLIALSDPDVLIKMQLPAEMDAVNGIANGVYMNGVLVYVTKANIVEENNNKSAVSDLGLVTGAYTFLGAGEPVKVWNDQQKAYTVPTDVEFDFVGQNKIFDMVIQPVLDGIMDADDVQIEVFPCDDVFDYGEGADAIMSAKVGTGTIMLAAIANNEIIAWSTINGTVGRKVPQIEGCSLTLDGKIGLNFYLDIPANVLETLGEGAYVELRRGFVTEQHVLLSDARRSGMLYKFTAHVSAKELHDTFALWLYDGEGKPVVLYGKYGELCVKGYQYSVADYCKLAEMTSGNEKLVDLAVDLLSYGNQAQNYFGYKTDTINELWNYRAYDMNEFAPETSSDLESVRYWGSSLLLKEETTLRHYFKFDDDVQNYLVTVDGEQVDLIQKGETYYLDIANIAAQDLDDMYTVSITKRNASEDGEMTLYYGPFSYARSAMKKNNDMNNLMMSMYHYYRAAEAYFNN